MQPSCKIPSDKNANSWLQNIADREHFVAVFAERNHFISHPNLMRFSVVQLGNFTDRVPMIFCLAFTKFKDADDAYDPNPQSRGVVGWVGHEIQADEISRDYNDVNRSRRTTIFRTLER